MQSAADPAQPAAFDILAAHVHRTGHTVTFHMTTHGTAGADIPQAGGGLAGARVWSYVWPTSLDPSVVGFEAGAGIHAMAATSHPDFDDTPLFDENRDGDTGNDGGVWHSHWVVLAPTPECGVGALAVKDIPEGTTPPLPLTWPGVPVLLDSPGYTPVFDGPEITVNAVVAGGAEGAAFDGVTAALRVNGDLHAPLLCVTDVFDIASGDLSLPGRVD
ncbi:hypothetical protein [Pseudoruegeria sp. SHC-113]|uniref:hypothetical protein n=1 Tax=Pseudoruegeria sp. SHC-113 TaxID=2855439 RepID=UPI0021BB56E1|nr:hypothetical protein [Pseudoruegeria sp. SHC-113]